MHMAGVRLSGGLDTGQPVVGTGCCADFQGLARIQLGDVEGCEAHRALSFGRCVFTHATVSKKLVLVYNIKNHTSNGMPWLRS